MYCWQLAAVAFQYCSAEFDEWGRAVNAAIYAEVVVVVEVVQGVGVEEIML